MVHVKMYLNLLRLRGIIVLRGIIYIAIQDLKKKNNKIKSQMPEGCKRNSIGDSR